MTLILFSTFKSREFMASSPGIHAFGYFHIAYLSRFYFSDHMSYSLIPSKMSQFLFRAWCMFHAPECTTFLSLSKRTKSSSGKVHIPATIRMIIKFSCAVPDIDQLVSCYRFRKCRTWSATYRLSGSEMYL